MHHQAIVLLLVLVLTLLGGGVSVSLAALLRGYRRLFDFAERIHSPE
jgi:hypothetical protein